MEVDVLYGAAVSARLVVNLFGVGLLVAGALAMLWPTVITLKRPLRWVFIGLAVAMAGFFLIRI